MEIRARSLRESINSRPGAAQLSAVSVTTNSSMSPLRLRPACTRRPAAAGITRKPFKKQSAGAMDRIKVLSFADIRKDPQLLAVAQTAGRITFAENCQPCHGAGGGACRTGRRCGTGGTGGASEQAASFPLCLGARCACRFDPGRGAGTA